MSNVRLLHRYLFRNTLLPLFISLVLFSFFVETLDILVNLTRYLNQNVAFSEIIRIQLLYLPTSISYALPIAILFSVTFSIGQMYSHNEFIAVFSVGVSFLRMTYPLIILGMMLGVANFYFREEVVIQTFREKNESMRQILNQEILESSSLVAIIEEGGEIVYYADYYDDDQKTLQNVIIVITDKNNVLDRRINAKKAQWNGQQWIFSNVAMYVYDDSTQSYEQGVLETYSNSRINSNPENFKRIIANIDEMKYRDALQYIEEIKARGHFYHKLLTDTYARIPLSFSPFIVMIIACISGSIFRKNIMLMSLLHALITAVIYYSADLMGSIFAARNVFSPLLGAWTGFLVVMMINVVLYKYFIK